MKFTIYDLRFTNRAACAESGAEATAVQTLTRLPGLTKPREASGLRRVHRRFAHGVQTTPGKSPRTAPFGVPPSGGSGHSPPFAA